MYCQYGVDCNFIECKRTDAQTHNPPPPPPQTKKPPNPLRMRVQTHVYKVKPCRGFSHQKYFVITRGKRVHMICVFVSTHVCTYKPTFANVYTRLFTVQEYIKDASRLPGERERATHWHVPLKFHLLCHCLTNCSTYSKHSSQRSSSEWGLHTPSLHLKILFHSISIVFLKWSQSTYLFIFRTHSTTSTDTTNLNVQFVSFYPG